MIVESSSCGFECIFSKKTDVWSFFSFANIELDHYYFHVVDAALFLNRKRIETPKRMSPTHFQEFIAQSFVSERLVLHLYPKDVTPAEIDNYIDFQESDCEMIILLYDFYYMEIYCKNKDWLQTLLLGALNIPGTIIEEKHEQTDTRTTMHV